ncbi:homocysteine S-methyltransferase [Saccharicrinis carchari]|uniref:Homocysteine S-methyltransferase n=1 Tax=Saccharicrinis carchari TaxID=1168039 RepID=A0A521F6N1_SACCC|nr:homocysteine S-methyltransferase family protein [Saccharicrinis carchari]SMO91271.1 homocysteine S-methyltransferase [Saccharicrinis carchari]
MKNFKENNLLLPEKYYLTDGGMETTLIFHQGIDIPYFATFDLLKNPLHRKAIDRYFRQYLDMAAKHNTGFILESVTWRAHSDWGPTLGYTQRELAEVNRQAVEQVKELRQEYLESIDHILVSGCIGPRYDGYAVNKDGWEDYKSYHSPQIKTLRDCGVDMVTALTINSKEEALGIVMAAKDINVPTVISFTVEMDGNLPDGHSLQEAIEAIDSLTDSYALYFMINCAHPLHFEQKLSALNGLSERICGIRANASCKSHAELDESPVLESGDKEELAQWYGIFKNRHPHIKVFGGCCGTDITHIEEICENLFNMDG